MTIRSRLQIIILAAVLVFSGLVGLNLWWQRQFGALKDQAALVTELNHTIFQRAQVRDEYLMYRNERAREQWSLLTRQVDEHLRRLPLALTGAEEQRIVQDMLAVQKRIASLFATLLVTQQGSAASTPQATELRERVITQMMNCAHDLYRDGLQLAALVNADMARYQRQTLVVGSCALLLLGVIVAGTGLVIKRSITRPIARFQEGVRIVAQGNLDAKIALRTGDELGRLSEAFDEMTEKLKVITVSRDELTEEVVKRREIEAALHKANEDLERSNRELEQFAYVASHDLQEPLRMVASYTQLLAQRYEGQLDEKAKKYIDYAVDGAVRMQRLINDLLAYSRIGTRGRQPEPTDAHAVLGEALKNLAAAIQESRAMVTNDDLPTVRADASQLALLFQNLVGNAIKFHGQADPRVHVAVADQPGEWVFSVHDNGIGIEPRYADRVFVIFQRLHTRDEYPGTGIGLAVAKRIVERHGGRIWFESAPGSGSTFFFTIPK